VISLIILLSIINYDLVGNSVSGPAFKPGTSE
jgi:hypothetical protein